MSCKATQIKAQAGKKKLDRMVLFCYNSGTLNEKEPRNAKLRNVQ